jgi:ADP-ribose pyrophosphatase YjhB (NUDIX family)
MRDHAPTRSPERVESGHVSAAARVDPELAAANYELRRGAKALVTSRGRALLVKERRSDGSSFWSLPGGGVECEESLRECLRREITEELRCQTTIGPAIDSCVYCHTNRPVATFYTVFEMTLEAKPKPNPTEGVVDHTWRRPTDLPRTTLTPIANVVSNTVPRE